MALAFRQNGTCFRSDACGRGGTKKAPRTASCPGRTEGRNAGCPPKRTEGYGVLGDSLLSLFCSSSLTADRRGGTTAGHEIQRKHWSSSLSNESTARATPKRRNERQTNAAGDPDRDVRTVRKVCDVATAAGFLPTREYPLLLRAACLIFPSQAVWTVLGRSTLGRVVYRPIYRAYRTQ